MNHLVVIALICLPAALFLFLSLSLALTLQRRPLAEFLNQSKVHKSTWTPKFIPKMHKLWLIGHVSTGLLSSSHCFGCVCVCGIMLVVAVFSVMLFYAFVLFFWCSILVLVDQTELIQSNRFRYSFLQPSSKYKKIFRGAKHFLKCKCSINNLLLFFKYLFSSVISW